MAGQPHGKFVEPRGEKDDSEEVCDNINDDDDEGDDEYEERGEGRNFGRSKTNAKRGSSIVNQLTANAAES